LKVIQQCTLGQRRSVPLDGDALVVHAATGAQRRRLVALRADGTIGDAAFQRLEEELDWAELGWAQVLPPEHRTRRP
jgi:monovalent cation/hydrogen antiporter